MRRVIAYYSWEERLWQERELAVPEPDPRLGGGQFAHERRKRHAEGQRAYARRQGLIRAQMRSYSEEMWKGVPADMAEGPGLPEGLNGEIYRVEYIPPPSTTQAAA